MSTWQSGLSSKRKEKDNAFDGFKTTKELAKPSRRHRHPPARLAPITRVEPSCHSHKIQAQSSRFNTHNSALLPNISRAEPTLSNNQLLAGYLANEFLSSGTLFGQPWDPDRGITDKSRRIEESKDEPSREVKKPKECYMEVADLLKMGEIHLPRIVNPTQLVRFLQLGKDVLLN
ncbi:hypothetical protein Leryth_021677 [Lithospermum erythrorhizon]|nr:hypothetical protein Leryth_021677 [Lithospermum erythrorhizon]